MDQVCRAADLESAGIVSRGALSQIGKEKIHDCFLVNGDIRCCHGGAQPLIPGRALGAPAQAEPVPGRKTINCVDVVIAAEPPRAGAGESPSLRSQAAAWHW